MKIVRVVGLVLLALFFLAGPVVALSGCPEPLTPAEQDKIADDSIKLSACAASAHLCKLAGGEGGIAECYREYDECMTTHGYADAGKDGR